MAGDSAPEADAKGGPPPAKRRRCSPPPRAPEAGEAEVPQRTTGVSRFKYGGARGKAPCVLDFVSGRFSYFSREQWSDRIGQGWLKLQPKDGEVQCTTPEQVLRNGDTLILDTPREEEPAVDTAVEDLWRDDRAGLLVVNKSGNLPVSESGKYRKNTLAFLTEERLGKQVWTVHRLDKETSGCVLMTFSASAARRAAARFSAGKVRKVYHAVLRGEMKAVTRVDRPVEALWKFSDADYCKDVPSMRKIRWCGVPSGREQEGRDCGTVFTPLRASHGLTLAQVEITRGRTHQIRVHAELAGFPLLGDKVYGHGAGSEKRSLALLRGEEPPVFGEHGRVERQLLHASRLEVEGLATEDSDGAATAATATLVAVADPIPVLRAQGGETVRQLLAPFLHLPGVHEEPGAEGDLLAVLPSGFR